MREIPYTKKSLREQKRCRDRAITTWTRLVFMARFDPTARHSVLGLLWSRKRLTAFERHLIHGQDALAEFIFVCVFFWFYVRFAGTPSLSIFPKKTKKAMWLLASSTLHLTHSPEMVEQHKIHGKKWNLLKGKMWLNGF